MITIPGEVASAASLAQGDRALVYELVRSWERHRAGNELRHAYYLMHNRLKDLGISVPPELRRLNAACGWGKKCVDVMVEHSKLDGLTAGDAEARALLGAISRRNHLRSLYRKATTSALEQCFALYLVTRDDETGHARVSAYPARVCGVKWDDAKGELAAAMFVVATKTDRSGTVKPTWVDVVTDDNVIRIRKGDRGWAADYEPHGLGHLPAFIAPFEATLERPFGTSRITREVMGYIDSAVRANVNEEIASAFAASTQKYLMGTDGDPFEHVTRWDTYIGSIVNVDMTADGTVPQFGQLPQPSMQPLSDHWRLLCGRMSAATGIHVSQFGQVHDNPASSDAIYAENEPLIAQTRELERGRGRVPVRRRRGVSRDRMGKDLRRGHGHGAGRGRVLRQPRDAHARAADRRQRQDGVRARRLRRDRHLPRAQRLRRGGAQAHPPRAGRRQTRREPRRDDRQRLRWHGRRGSGRR